MLLIRRIEERVAESYGEQKIGGFTHLYIGQEAVGVGALSVLNADDYVISTYRDHGHFLARGGDPKKFMAELFGRATGICKGKGGSMHLADSEHYFYGGTGIVGGSIPIASGLGLACKYREDDRVVMCFFGDGATNQGVWHEGLNFAKLWDLPVVFICENNFYGIGTGVHQSSSLSEVYKKAQGYGMPGYRVNGMDVLEVRQLWRKRDPLPRLAKQLMEEGVISADRLKELDREIEALCEEAVRFAEESPEPDLSSLTEDVFVERYPSDPHA